jgi:hypothetical protein
MIERMPFGGEARDKPIITRAPATRRSAPGGTRESAMSGEKLSRIDPGWAGYHGFESPLLQEWVVSGPFGARLLGINLPKVALASQARTGALARRLEGGSFEHVMGSHIERDAPLARRLSERAPDRPLLTRGDEFRQLERTRLALIDIGIAAEERPARDARRAA